MCACVYVRVYVTPELQPTAWVVLGQMHCCIHRKGDTWEESLLQFGLHSSTRLFLSIWVYCNAWNALAA